MGVTYSDGVAVKVKRPRARAVDRVPLASGPALPGWLEARDYQLDAVDKIAAAYARGAKVVMLDAPVGCGKTAIGEMVRREMGVERALYVCTNKTLQTQVAQDFEYARVLKGRRNYIPTGITTRESDGYRQGFGGTRAAGITCQDCDAGPAGEDVEDQTCSHCVEVATCPYRVARAQAYSAPLGVLNTSYLLAECNGPGRFRGRELVIADEADLLEDELLGYVELRIGTGVARELKVQAPKKGSHMTTIRAWLAEEVKPAIKDRLVGARKERGVEARRKVMRLERLADDVQKVVDREDGWVRENDDEERGSQALVLKPVSIEDVGERYLWRHGERWLLMSGTTVSAEMQADALGLTAAGIEWDVVQVDSQFDAANRRVVYVPAGTMTRKGQEAGAVPKVMRALERVLEKHPTGNVLVHTFSYQLAKDTVAHLKNYMRIDPRRVITYTEARQRDGALGSFKAASSKGGAILVASSMDRGIDLPGDLCRVMVVMKMPMASLGGAQVGTRLHSPGGDAWYLMGTIRTLMQQCGRAVRGTDDHAVTYVLDQHFGKVLKDGKRLGMFPQWWLDGLESGRLRDYV